jgi:hypothetical protein
MHLLIVDRSYINMMFSTFLTKFMIVKSQINEMLLMQKNIKSLSFYVIII